MRKLYIFGNGRVSSPCLVWILKLTLMTWSIGQFSGCTKNHVFAQSASKYNESILFQQNVFFNNETDSDDDDDDGDAFYVDLDVHSSLLSKLAQLLNSTTFFEDQHDQRCVKF